MDKKINYHGQSPWNPQSASGRTSVSLFSSASSTDKIRGFSASKIRVGIFMGGISSEKEVSLESGRHVYNNLPDEKYEKITIFMDSKKRFWEMPFQLVVLNTTRDIEDRLEGEAERLNFEDLPKKIDFAFLALHGKYVEDGCLQGLLEYLKVPYNGSGVLSSALGMDKYMQRKLFKIAGLNVPKYMKVGIEEWKKMPEKIIGKISEQFTFPCISKPAREGCSTAITKIKSKDEIMKALDDAFKWDNTVLVEEFLDGMEVTTVVLGNDEPYALVPTETPKHKHDYLTLEDKFLPGGAEMITPPRLPKEMIKKVQEAAVLAYKTIGCKVYTRIDQFVVGERVIILEPNTLPGITPSTCVFHQAAEVGMSPSDFLEKVVQLSLEAHKEKVGPL